jgi:hypothetical protein
MKVAEMFMNLLHACIKLESSRNVYEFVIHASIKLESSRNVYEFVTCMYKTGK